MKMKKLVAVVLVALVCLVAVQPALAIDLNGGTNPCGYNLSWVEQLRCVIATLENLIFGAL
ncbi:MAG: hypothetical protein NTV06_02140 [candidate division Zixibacteria bacterium]|nr:hypothetical protein [candidate division Zixibacteria bacterium]